jgi:2-phospho-L-lactate/phosphoenolpyruvate guanylyltransferase
MTGSLAGPGWFIVIPVKNLPRAKSRLALPPPLRARVAHAMALDTVAAALCADLVDEVVIVTDEAADFRRLGARIVPDAPRAGLNAALSRGVEHGVPNETAGVAALTADLPALRPAELAGALAAVPAAGRAVVADAAGDGTTLLAAAGGRALRPQFGRHSHRRHRDGGALDLTSGVGPGLRQDVDTVADLQAAAILGLGRYTAIVLPELTAWLPPPAELPGGFSGIPGHERPEA